MYGEKDGGTEDAAWQNRNDIEIPDRRRSKKKKETGREPTGARGRRKRSVTEKSFSEKGCDERLKNACGRWGAGGGSHTRIGLYSTQNETEGKRNTRTSKKGMGLTSGSEENEENLADLYRVFWFTGVEGRKYLERKRSKEGGLGK